MLEPRSKRIYTLQYFHEDYLENETKVVITKRQEFLNQKSDTNTYPEGISRLRPQIELISSTVDFTPLANFFFIFFSNFHDSNVIVTLN